MWAAKTDCLLRVTLFNIITIIFSTLELNDATKQTKDERNHQRLQAYKTENILQTNKNTIKWLTKNNYN